MSATGRGAIRMEQDFYATPRAAFQPLIQYIWDTRAKLVFEPACGDGRILNWLMEAGIDQRGNDLKRGYDFLKDESIYDCIVTNPPFSLAFEFCQHAVPRAEHVFLLLRLNFLASGRRREWFRDNEPNALFVLSDRPSFVKSCRCLNKACGHKWSISLESERPKWCLECMAADSKIKITSSDSCEYAWYYWGPTHKGIFHL